MKAKSIVLKCLGYSRERKKSISSSNFDGKLPDLQSHVSPLSTWLMVLLQSVPGGVGSVYSKVSAYELSRFVGRVQISQVRYVAAVDRRETVRQGSNVVFTKQWLCKFNHSSLSGFSSGLRDIPIRKCLPLQRPRFEL